jgi:tetratricopeptide (TPR) repeat protein
MRAHFEQGEKAQQQGDLQAALRAFQKAIELDRSDAEAHARLGLVYRKLGMLREATESLERARRLDPKLPRLGVLLAFNYMDAGRHADAIPLLAAEFDLEREPAVRSIVGQRLVQCYLETGNEHAALPIVEKLRQIAPDNPDVLQLALRSYMNLWNGAFQQLLSKAPDSHQARQILAEGLEAQERFAEAASEYRQILKAEPRLPDVHYRLGRAILRSDASSETDEKALSEFRKELEINAQNVAALAEIGEIHLKRSQLQEASRSFSKAFELQPGYVPARIGLAKLLIAENEWSKALEHLEASAKLAPYDEAVHYNLMIAYRGLGRAEDAKRAFDAFERLKQAKQQSRPSFLRGKTPQ